MAPFFEKVSFVFHYQVLSRDENLVVFTLA